MKIQCSFEYCNNDADIPDDEIIWVCPRCATSNYVYDKKEWRAIGIRDEVLGKALDFVSHVGRLRSLKIVSCINDYRTLDKLFNAFGAYVNWEPVGGGFISIHVVLGD